MNENLNLVEILKDCPKGTKLYSTTLGEVRFIEILNGAVYPIVVSCNDVNTEDFTADGKLRIEYDGECTLFPSREERNWSNFKPKKQKFDPKTLQPYMKVLVRDNHKGEWNCSFFSHIDYGDVNFPYIAINTCYTFCIPYNEETKHLVGTNEEAPEFYRYWEDKL